jgi:general secretion pathway protein D
VGFVMNVTAQIGEDDVVVINVRPSVSSIIGYVNDPNPDLAKAGVISQVPEIQSREFESVMRVPSGATAILGGLMQDRTETQRDGLPGAFAHPVLRRRRELSQGHHAQERARGVPAAVRGARPSIEGDLAAYRRFLPDSEFFREARPTLPELEKKLERLEYGLPPEPNGTPR